MVLVAASNVYSRDPEFVTKNSEGREFWLCFMKNFREAGQKEGNSRQDQLRLQLFITSSYDATVRITIEELQYDNTITIKANSVVPVQLPARAQLRLNESPERLAIHVTADTAISVYGLNSRFQTTDTFLGLPISVLGTEYRVIGYTKLSADLVSALSVVATEDNTEVTITPSVVTSTGRPARTPFTVRLRKGDVYTVSAKYESIGTCDLTGSLVTANKKVSVFSGHNCTYVPPKVEACNHLIEQIPPMSAWGKHYYLGMLKERSRYTFRVIAAENDTKVFEDSRLVAVMKAGEFYENLNVSRHVQVTADKPVLVAQFAQGFKNGDSVGDPMMILVSPTQQFLKDYRIATPISGDWHHYINLVSPTNAIGQIRLNGKRVDSSLFVVLGESRYSIAQVPIPFGSHSIKSETPFGLYSYGFGYRADAYDAYGNMAGQSFLELNKLVDSLPPQADGKAVRDDFVVTFRDDRPMDKGLRSIKVLTSAGLEAQIPKIEEGAPQASVRIRQTSAGSAGRIMLRAEDAAGNVSTFTVCHVFDSRSERYMYLLSEGTDVMCEAEGAWMAGAFWGIGSMFHDVNMALPDMPSARGLFTAQYQGTYWGGGVLLARRLTQDLVVAGRLGFTTVGGSFTAPDSTFGSRYDTLSGAYVPYQEGTMFTITSPLIHLGAGIEWFPHRYFYLTTGLQLSMMIGSNVDVQRVIMSPASAVYPGGGTTQPVDQTTLTSLNSTSFGYYGGLGFSYPVTFRTSVFVETMYTAWFGNLVGDGPWTTQRLGINVGARVRW